MKKNKYIIWTIMLIIIAILIPILLDHLVFGNTVPSFLSNGEWAGFLGSYIGGICTLIALIATIQYYRSADEKKEKAEVQPFLHVRVGGSSANLSTGFTLPGKTEKDIRDLQRVIVTIKNIGNGLYFALQFVDSMRNEYIQEYEVKKEGSRIVIECGYPTFMDKR